jgi:hypothetical protein
MSEIDRLSNSGLYPALPIADQHRNKGESPGKPPPDPRAAKSNPKPAGGSPDPAAPRPPKSIIDEYA